MKLIIHRGTHQIGGSCVEVMAGKTRIVVDAGLPLPSLEDEATFEAPVFPDVKGLFKSEVSGEGKVQFPYKNIFLISDIHCGVRSSSEEWQENIMLFFSLSKDSSVI